MPLRLRAQNRSVSTLPPAVKGGVPSAGARASRLAHPAQVYPALCINLTMSSERNSKQNPVWFHKTQKEAKLNRGTGNEHSGGKSIKTISVTGKILHLFGRGTGLVVEKGHKKFIWQWI